MNHKELEVWKRSVDLVLKLYKITEKYPHSENYGLVDQIRRAAVSIPSNIAEGCGRNSDKELIRFLYISIGSLAEVDTQLIISNKLGYLDIDKLDDIADELNIIKKMLLGLIKYLKGKSK